MDDVVKKSLHDILTAIEEVESFFGDKPKLFEEFCGNICLKRAIERNIEIIGEARVPVAKALNALGAECTLREGVKKCGPVITDNGNQILDIVWKNPVDSELMEDKINSIVGVVEVGFFTKNKPIVFTMDSNEKVIQR